MHRGYQRILCVLLLLSSTAAFAAGDYIWEERFRKALPQAEQGDAKAQYAIGHMYEVGRGTNRDLGKAFIWYSKAAQQGDVKAYYKLGMAYLEGKGVKRDYQKAYRWLKKASDKGYVRAHHALGEMFERGLGLDADLTRAKYWYQLALKGGYGNAAADLQRISELARRREAKLAQLQQEARKAAKAVKVQKQRQKKAAPPPPPKKILSTKQRVLLGGWKKGKRPVEFLPSAITQCKVLEPRLECLSEPQRRSVGIADIEYLTKAIVFAFRDDGQFKVSYRNKVTAVTVTDEGAVANGAKVPVKIGWQNAEHKLVCHVEDDHHVTCSKNKLRTLKLQR